MLRSVLLAKVPTISARKKLEAGPASATIAESLLGCLKYAWFTGTGLPHPIPANKNIKLPYKSRCLRGSRVTLPLSLAVLSPSRLATKACAASWTLRLINTAITKVKKLE